MPYAMHCNVMSCHRTPLKNTLVMWVSCITIIIIIINSWLLFHTIYSNIYYLFQVAIHIGAHIFNFENLVNAYDDSELSHQLSIMSDVRNDTHINPVRKQNSVSNLYTFYYYFAQHDTPILNTPKFWDLHWFMSSGVARILVRGRP